MINNEVSGVRLHRGPLWRPDDQERDYRPTGYHAGYQPRELDTPPPSNIKTQQSVLPPDWGKRTTAADAAKIKAQAAEALIGSGPRSTFARKAKSAAQIAALEKGRQANPQSSAQRLYRALKAHGGWMDTAELATAVNGPGVGFPINRSAVAANLERGAHARIVLKRKRSDGTLQFMWLGQPAEDTE